MHLTNTPSTAWSYFEHKRNFKTKTGRSITIKKTKTRQFIFFMLMLAINFTERTVYLLPKTLFSQCVKLDYER